MLNYHMVFLTDDTWEYFCRVCITVPAHKNGSEPRLQRAGGGDVNGGREAKEVI